MVSRACHIDHMDRAPHSTFFTQTRSNSTHQIGLDTLAIAHFILSNNMDPSGNKATEGQMLVVETAIPLFRSNDDISVGSMPDLLPRGEAFEEDDDDDLEYGGSQLDEENEDEIDHDAIDWTVKRDGAIMGLLVGCFIQFASLGARFMLTAVFLKNQELVITRKNLVELSLGWSFLTSTMGVGILFAVGSLMSKGSVLDSKLVENWRSNLELSFAIGALSSVCLAWSATDLVLGVPGHAFESVLIWLAAIAWAKLGAMVSHYWSNRSQQTTDDDLKQSLLTKVEKEEKTSNPRIAHLVNGFLVGCFIQFSSLGANFLLQAIFNEGIKGKNGNLSGEVITFSLIWSVATSAMGVAILVLMRNVLNAVCVKIESMECSYSLGAILGVNLSWIVTDCILGYASLPSWWHWILVIGSLVCGAFL